MNILERSIGLYYSVLRVVNPRAYLAAAEKLGVIKYLEVTCKDGQRTLVMEAPASKEGDGRQLVVNWSEWHDPQDIDKGLTASQKSLVANAYMHKFCDDHCKVECQARRFLES